MTTTHTLCFSVSGTVTQSIELVDTHYPVDEIPLLLEEGTLITTTWFNTRSRTHESQITDHHGHVIAHIIKQEVEGEYEDFALNE